MDVKVGSGAFLPGRAQARGWRARWSRSAGALGLPVRALLTDMDQPLGAAIGNAAEVARGHRRAARRRAAPTCAP